MRKTNRHYRVRLKYPFDVVQSEQMFVSNSVEIGYINIIFDTEDEAMFYKYSLMIEDDRLSKKQKRRLNLRVKYILNDNPEYKL